MTTEEDYFYLAEQWYKLALYWSQEPASIMSRSEYLKCKIQAYLYLNKAKESIHGIF